MHLRRLPVMAIAMLSLVAAVWGGLVRLGWWLPPLRPTLAAFHGPLMVSGFLGTLIGLERAAGLGTPWAWAAPLATGLGGVMLGAGAGAAGALLVTAGSAVLLAVFLRLVRREPALHTVTVALGAGAWLAGNLLWLAGWPVHRVGTWWGAFLVLVIAGERQELTRLLPRPPHARVLFLAAAGLLLGGSSVTTLAPDAGARMTGVAMLGLALWLLRWDMARRTVREPGLPRFMAICLLSGYVWLAVAGVLGVVFGAVSAGPRYDAVLHALFLGFVFAMIFAHAPVIFPGVLGVPIAFRPRFWAHVALLHASLAVRIAGDLLPSLGARQWGGLGNALALVVFLGNTVGSVRRRS
jgi:hypothetical protein